VIYFDQAATTYPKPKEVIEAITHTLEHYSANPGRSGHKLSRGSAKNIEGARQLVAHFFGVDNSETVIFHANATSALNQCIKGFPFNKGDHVISTAYEHNAVRRPLEYVKREKGIEISYIKPNHQGVITSESIKKSITSQTKCIIATHGSNVTGAITPIEEIGHLAKEKGLFFIVDVSQTAGVLPIHMKKMNIDMLAFTGHKGLLGPQGIGGLIMREKMSLSPLIHGGTGQYPDVEEQPDVWPKKYESGTLNAPGISGLSKGIQFIKQQGINKIYEHEWLLTKYCMEKLMAIQRVTIYGPPIAIKRLAVIPFSIEGISCEKIAEVLDEEYDIAVRAGKHCAPLTHHYLRTSETGTVRVSFGVSNTKEEIDTFITALIEIIDQYI
jgi:cysteine desulfurase / selenocysteine lyase